MFLKFKQPTCPKCGEHPRGMLEVVFACAELTEPDADGDYEYFGNSAMFWNTQEPVFGEVNVEPDGVRVVRCGPVDDAGRVVTLLCHNDCPDWRTEVTRA